VEQHDGHRRLYRDNRLTMFELRDTITLKSGIVILSYATAS
jgi:hypothetical protein